MSFEFFGLGLGDSRAEIADGFAGGGSGVFPVLFFFLFGLGLPDTGVEVVFGGLVGAVFGAGPFFDGAVPATGVVLGHAFIVQAAVAVGALAGCGEREEGEEQEEVLHVEVWWVVIRKFKPARTLP